MGYLIKGGTVITESGEVRADVSIDDQRISAIGKDLPESAERITLDATGKYVLPGVIDAHTHFALRSRGTVSYTHLDVYKRQHVHQQAMLLHPLQDAQHQSAFAPSFSFPGEHPEANSYSS